MFFPIYFHILCPVIACLTLVLVCWFSEHDEEAQTRYDVGGDIFASSYDKLMRKLRIFLNYGYYTISFSTKIT